MLYSIPVGICLGLLPRGNLQGLLVARLRLAPAFILSFLLQLVLFSSPVASTDWVRTIGPPVYIFSLALVLVAVVANLWGLGPSLVAAGAVCNFAVITANGGKMPVLAEALYQTKGEAAVVSLAMGQHFTNVTLMGEKTRLSFLGDVFYLPPGVPFANVFSIGDVLAALGAAVWIASLMRSAPSGPSAQSDL